LVPHNPGVPDAGLWGDQLSGGAAPPARPPTYSVLAQVGYSRGGRMVSKGNLATTIARPGREAELEAFLASAQPLAEQEPGTIAWFAIKIDDRTYGIFDVFEDEAGRQAHLNGPIAAGLMAKSDELLSQPPDLKMIDVVAGKLPS
jgi:quinol monooxygenase YgiN